MARGEPIGVGMLSPAGRVAGVMAYSGWRYACSGEMMAQPLARNMAIVPNPAHPSEDVVERKCEPLSVREQRQERRHKESERAVKRRIHD
jgi:hypothetical protein